MFLIITLDVDSQNQNNKYFDTKNICFDFEKEINTFLKKLDKPTTFFVRTDYQTIEKFGNEHVFNLIRKITKNFDVELGWHPHFFEKYKPIRNLKKLLDNLKDIWNKVEWIHHSKCVRIGSCQNSNEIMRWLAKNFEIDSSAMPKCKREDEIRYYNWETTQLNPYFPSKNDYKINGENNLDILEIPITTLITKAPYDKTPKRRILNCNLQEKIFQKSIKDNIDELQNLDCIVVCSHVDELQEGYSDDLYCFGINTYINNLKFLESKFNVEYKKITDFSNWWKSCNTKHQ